MHSIFLHSPSFLQQFSLALGIVILPPFFFLLYINKFILKFYGNMFNSAFFYLPSFQLIFHFVSICVPFCCLHLGNTSIFSRKPLFCCCFYSLPWHSWLTPLASPRTYLMLFAMWYTFWLSFYYCDFIQPASIDPHNPLAFNFNQ